MGIAFSPLVTGHNNTDDIVGGRYRLVRLLATGGMAEIYLATKDGEAGFARQVVVKRILRSGADSPSTIAMFRDEARILAAMQHPNVVRVEDIGVDGRDHFYVMEHLDGMDAGCLMRILEHRGARMPYEHAVQIALGAAAGLHAAHEARDLDGRLLHLIHRDVSPGNIVITFGGGVKLIDFGVAKAEGRETVTEAGVVKGKISFMSPEQLLCKELDHRSDIFALGAVLHELTTGVPLFNGLSPFETMQQIVKTPVPRPSERVPGYPRALEAIVMRALARRPEDRFQTAADLFVALEEVATELGLPLSSWALGSFAHELSQDPVAQEDVATAHGLVLWGDEEIGRADRTEMNATGYVDDPDDGTDFEPEDTIDTGRHMPGFADHLDDCGELSDEANPFGMDGDASTDVSVMIADPAPTATIQLPIDLDGLDAVAGGAGRRRLQARRPDTITELGVKRAPSDGPGELPLRRALPLPPPRLSMPKMPARSARSSGVAPPRPGSTALGTAPMSRLVPRPEEFSGRRGARGGDKPS
jgi:serine/threonine protein kinase